MPHIDRPSMRPAFAVTMKLIAYASELRGVDPLRVANWDRTREIAYTRFGVMWVLRHLGLSYPRIARHVGQRDHTTVIHGERRANGMRETDPEYRDFTDKLLAYALTLEPIAVAKKAA